MPSISPCPSCGFQYQIPNQYVPSQIQCQNCGNWFVAGILPHQSQQVSANRSSSNARWIWIGCGSAASLVVLTLILFSILGSAEKLKQLTPVSLEGNWYGVPGYAINLPDSFKTTKVSAEDEQFEMSWKLDSDPKSALNFYIWQSATFKKNSKPNIHTKPGNYRISGPGRFFVIEGAVVEKAKVEDVVFHIVHHPVNGGSKEATFSAVARLNGAEVVITGTSAKGNDSPEFKMLLDVIATFQLRNSGVVFPSRRERNLEQNK